MCTGAHGVLARLTSGGWMVDGRMDGECGTGQSGQTNADAKSEGPSAGAPSEPARVGNWNGGRDSEWD